MIYNFFQFGIVASFFGVVSFIPIVHNVISTKKANNFVWSAIVIALLSTLFWGLEGLRTNSLPLVINSFIFICFYISIAYVKFFNKN